MSDTTDDMEHLAAHYEVFLESKPKFKNMDLTITVKEVSQKGEWYNVVTDKGQKIGIKNTNKKLVDAIIETAGEVPFNLTGNVVQTKTGIVMWDIEEKKEKPSKFQDSPEKQKSIVIQSSIGSAVAAYANIYAGPEDDENILALAKKFIDFHNSEMLK